MGDQLDRWKDVAIAFLSTSALLLTLMLGFISVFQSNIMFFKAGTVKTTGTASSWDVVISTVALFSSAASSTLALFLLSEEKTHESKKLGRQMRLLFVFQFVSFMFGLFFLAVAIVSLTIFGS